VSSAQVDVNGVKGEGNFKVAPIDLLPTQ